ncbi:LysR family transcriptional regulator [soil metagenome]
MQPRQGVSKPQRSFRFDELGVLVTVAEAGSLSAAAKQLGIPKSTVGRAIARLEDELGVSLVRRMARGPTLTEPGLVLANRAAPHIAGLRDAATAQGRESHEAYGVLRMTAPADVGAHVIAPLLAGFFARHPRVRIEIENTLRVVDLVREGFDLAIRVTMGRLPASTLIARKLAPMNLAFYASTQYAARNDLPKHLDDFGRHDNVVFYPGTNTVTLQGPNGPEKLTVNGRASGNDFFFVREAILSGVGIGPLPWFLASHEVAAGRLTRVLPEYRVAGGTAYLVYPPAKPLAPKLVRFCAHLLEHVPRLTALP